MPIEDTSLGGPNGTFPTTSWGELVRLWQADGPDSRDILGRLVASYWRPVYITIRRAWGKSVEDAKDITQEFVSRIMTGEQTENVDPAKGRFRDWLKAALRHFLLQTRRDATAQKRGGQAVVLPLDSMDRIELPSSDAKDDPARVFDLEWGKELFQRAIEAPNPS